MKSFSINIFTHIASKSNIDIFQNTLTFVYKIHSNVAMSEWCIAFNLSKIQDIYTWCTRPSLLKCTFIFLSGSLSDFLTLHDIINGYAIFEIMFYCRLAAPVRKYLSADHDWWQCQGLVLLTLLRHVARILANGRAAFFENCDAIGWNSCDVSQKR